MRTRTVGLLVAALALTACSDGTPSASPASSAPPTPAPTASPSVDLPEQRFVPQVTGRRLAEATAHLERRGFQVRADTVELSSCVPDGLVLRQHPPARAIRDVGSRVTLAINSDPGSRCGLDLPPAAR